MRRAVPAVALLLLIGAPSGPTRAADTCAGTTDAGGGWLASRPTFAAGLAAVTVAVTPIFSPDLLYATNGAVVSRSEDGGCTWVASYSATSARGSVGAVASAAITALSAPSSATSSSYVLAGVTIDVSGVALPRVAVSSDRGRSWVASTELSGLPAVGTVTQVVANPTVPQTAYAVISDLAGGQVVYATADGGESWAQRTPTAGAYDGTQLTVDPTTQTQLLARAGGRVVRSIDGGATFAPTASGPAGALSLAPGGGGVRLAATRTGANAVVRSDDAGVTWREQPVALLPTTVAMAPLQDLFAVADSDRVLLGPLDISPLGGAPSQLALSARTATGFALTGVRAGQVLRVTLGPAGGVLPPVGLTPVRLRVGGAAEQFAPLLLPQRTRIRLAAGATTRVPYSLVVPRTPTPVDLMFVIDTTGSMGGVIDGLRQDLGRIVTALGSAGLQAQFGVAEFRDYSTPGDEIDYPYRRDRVIGPADASLTAALNTLTAGGGGDGPESALTGLLQSASGAGQEPWVKAGQGAQWRAGSFRFALTAADTEFHRAGDDYSLADGSKTWPGPTFEAAVAAMRANGVHQIGLAANGGPTVDLARAARDTDALAPPGGIDCDANGTIDVPAGEPMVCALNSGPADVGVGVSGIGTGAGGTALAGAVVGAVNGIRDLRPVRLAVVRGQSVAALHAVTVGPGGSRRTGPVQVRPSSTVNLKADNELSYDLDLTCPVAPAASYDVALSATTPLTTLAAAGLVLDCAAPGVRVAPVVPPVAGADPARAAAPGPAPPVQQPVPNPNPNVNPGPNVNPNANPQVGAAEQQETQSQLAFATDAAPDESESLAMSGLFVGSAALMLSCATGMALRQRVSERGAPEGR